MKTSSTTETSATKILVILINKGRQSITELITLHKLFTSKPQVPKFVPRINPKLENEIKSLASEEELDVHSDTKSEITPNKLKRTINDWEAFYWTNEFDEIIAGTHSEIYNDCNPFTKVQSWSNSHDCSNYKQKYKILSSFMEIKADKIRKVICFNLYLFDTYNQDIFCLSLIFNRYY